MPPCLTPFSVAKNSDLTPFHVVHMHWRVYIYVVFDQLINNEINK